MDTKDDELTKQELEAQSGEPLPTREVMSFLTTNPGLIAIPEDPTIVTDGTTGEPEPKPLPPRETA
jgi:hypothetical protein